MIDQIVKNEPKKPDPKRPGRKIYDSSVTASASGGVKSASA